MASWWISLFNLARELRSHSIPVVGPGSRPYKRTHLIAQLVEPMCAYLESPDSEIAISAQRALFVLIANLTDHAPHSVFDFKGRIAICKLFAAAVAARNSSARAIDWIADAAARFSTVLVEAEMLSPSDAAVLLESAAQIVTDIRGRDGGDALTIEDLGIFARPKHCLQLLTVHKAKGREFEAVAVIEAHDGRFPHFSIARITDQVEREAQYNESRRVMYVAVTRAKRVLMFFSDNSDYRNRPSPFLTEMGL
jgi:DNA helicase-2/ATP-dependent DNA helicase PcrA